MAIKKVKFPDNSTQDVHDARITGIDTTPTDGSTNVISSGGVYTALGGKQDTISDLATIRSGASAGASAYQKPSGGIPKTDLASAVVALLDKAITSITSSEDGTVVFTMDSGDTITLDLNHTHPDKQDLLVSGTNIKTINGNSILGSGNIQIEGGGAQYELIANKVTSMSSSSTDTEYPSAKCVYDAIDDATQNLVSYPTFEINNAMHLTMSSPDASALSLFSVDNNGHLIMTV